MRYLYLPLIGIALIGAMAQSVKGPQSPNEEPREFRITTHSDLVLLDVSVKDPAGGFVTGLTKDQFKIFDNGREQTIQVFEAGDIPVTVGLVVDNSQSMRSKKPEAVTAALTFVTESNPKDEMFVVNFNDSARLALSQKTPFTDEPDLLRAALLSNRVEGRTALNDALKLGLFHLQKGLQAKKTLILISDGGDNASDLATKDLFRLAERSIATIYTIGIYDSDDRDKNPAFLRKIATLTGGECFIPDKLTDLVGVCKKIAKDIRNRYSIGFVPSAATGVRGGEVRKIKVEASAPDRGKLIVRTRTHYRTAVDAASPTASAKAPGERQ